MKTFRKIIENRNALAWIILALAIGLHVFDEAMTNFLPAYNQIVLNFREKLGFFPFPTFSFGLWLGGLIVGIILAYAITYFVVRGGKIIRVITTIFGFLMVVNALSHFGGSIYFNRIFPGMWSSPFLLAAALFVIFQGFKGNWQVKEELAQMSPENA